MSKRQVVLLSPGGDFLAQVAGELRRRRVQPAALLVYVPSVFDAWRRIASPSAKAVRLPTLPFRWAARPLRLLLSADIRKVAHLRLTGRLNGRRMVRALRALQPDVLVLVRCGLLSDEVISIPREGALNVHPGLLPWVRGNSPIVHSLQRGVALGATAFRVNAGIDTGPILDRRLVPIAGGEEMDELRASTTRLWVEMTADLVERALAGRLERGEPQAERHPLCREAAAAEVAEAGVIQQREDLAKAIFDRWAPLCSDSERLSLPAAIRAPHASLQESRTEPGGG